MLRRRSWGMVAALVAPLVVSNAVFAQQPVDEEEELGEELPEEEAPAPAPGAPAPAPAAPEAPAPEAPVEDFAEAEEEENPRRPPPAGKGVIWGVITDAASKEPIIDAQVTEVKSNRKAIADLDGRYRLELSPGEYEIRVWYEIYKAERVQNIRVKAGELTRIDVALGKDEQQATEEVIEVEFEVERASVASQLLLRKNAAQVGDAIGAQEISRTPDRSASEAAKRVVGATVIGGRYVVVRGLGDRYTNSLLNGAPLPSPEPDRQAVPLDLFPTLILSDITILKTFTPDMPGDFAGGSVRINTRELPSRFQAQAQLTLGFNTLSTFQDRVSYEGGGLDWLGV
ncbi:MAG TPA: carboxypeptidase regulatory-like domain-containing protein, partial [Candidatus Nanopelagicales bacterium]|nr:carboxypeptidase regulatory-like domain-containing protein [Candidatus Nanopelagicales bacterium]